jgi:hypothetical protein
MDIEPKNLFTKENQIILGNCMESGSAKSKGHQCKFNYMKMH